MWKILSGKFLVIFQWNSTPNVSPDVLAPWCLGGGGVWTPLSREGDTSFHLTSEYPHCTESLHQKPNVHSRIPGSGLVSGVQVLKARTCCTEGTFARILESMRDDWPSALAGFQSSQERNAPRFHWTLVLLSGKVQLE